MQRLLRGGQNRFPKTEGGAHRINGNKHAPFRILAETLGCIGRQLSCLGFPRVSLSGGGFFFCDALLALSFGCVCKGDALLALRLSCVTFRDALLVLSLGCVCNGNALLAFGLPALVLRSNSKSYGEACQHDEDR